MPSVVDLVKERFGELTEIQKLAIPRVLAGENVLILAPTGYGKTESALLPILEKLKDKKGGIRALYITPLRALSRDLKERFGWWCERLGITHDIRTGDTTAHERTKHRKDPPQILLTTVESLQALLLGRLMRGHLANVEFVIVDEVHDVLDNKRGAQLSLALERLALFAKFQRIAISATVSDESEAAKLIFGNREYAICECGKNRQMNITIENIENPDSRISRIKDLAEQYRCLIFVNTRSSAEELGASVKKLGAPIEIHHGSLSKELRLDTEDRFKSGLIRSILCTSSLELGIDVGDISLVIQCGSPHQVFRLIQRVGRSGHSMQKTPRGIILANDFDDLLESEVVNIFSKNGKIEGKFAERSALDVIAHQLVGLCLDLGRIELAKAHEIFSRSYAYGLDLEKLRKVALQLFNEGLIYYDEQRTGSAKSSEAGLDPVGGSYEEIAFIKATARARIYYVSCLSTIPKSKHFFLREIVSNSIISRLDEEFVVNLEPGTRFLSNGRPWLVVDITENEVLAEQSAGGQILVPSWSGEDIPVSFEVAQQVGMLRSSKELAKVPDEKTVILEIIGAGDLVVLHACFGTRVNDTLARIYAKKLSSMVGESVHAVSDPYRILIKLPFPLKGEHLLEAFSGMHNIRWQLSEALLDSSLVRLKFHHVGRMFGLLSEDATVSSRFINALRNSVVYEETMRSIFFRYFDSEKTEDVLNSIKAGKIRLLLDIRKDPSYFARIGMNRISGGESIGAFEPREKIIQAFKESALSKTLQLFCLNCGASRFMHLAGAPEIILCHKCNQPSFVIAPRENIPKSAEDQKLEAALIRAYGKRALIALSTYGIGPATASRVLKKLHQSEETFYLNLIESQKLFIKNKKYWQL